MCKDHEQLRADIESVKEDVRITRGEMSSLREDMNVSVNRFVSQLESIERNLKSQADSTGELVQVFRDGKGFYRVLKWSAATITLIAGAWYAVTHGFNK